MKIRMLSVLFMLLLIISGMPGSAAAKSKQMESDVPVWTEKTVRQYILDYVEGKSMDRLWGYYDLQIRRYMPMATYSTMLSELSWMTGKFVSLGSYSSFSESGYYNYPTTTHVLHLCMEKQDLNLYFTHKNKEDDWEIMAIEFVPADKEVPHNQE